jgi:predicted membrane channel-forming protein YqfA (hemolysin III family)
VLLDKRGMQIPDAVLPLMLTGGVLFTIGTIFHIWRNPALPECDMAWLRASGSSLSLCGHSETHPGVFTMRLALEARQ